MQTITGVLQSATLQLQGFSASPRLDAEVLLGQVLGRPRASLIAHGELALGADADRAFAQLLAERRRGVPVAYLTGVREFWSLPLRLTPAVLVPRPETETLVEQVLARIGLQGDARVLDLGTGSGAIALALASERPLARITATDISAPALEVARHNGRSLGLDRVDWRCGSWFEPVAGERFDLIVSNPPYVAARDPALETLSAEPRLALTPGDTGYEAFELILAGASRHLRRGGVLALEHGSTQATTLSGMFAGHGFEQISTHVDAAGLPRVTLATINPSHQDLP